jgi:GTP-binding protein
VGIAVVGRPNVGKSSLVNQLLGYTRVVVSETPGTTRDAIDTPFQYEGRRYVLVDTAGIRRKSRISARLEKYSVVMALRSLARSDVALVLIDASEGLADQDARIASLADERGRGLIFVVNKWDLLEKDDRTAGQVARVIQERLRSLSYAPVVTVSAKTGQRVSRILNLVDQVVAEHRRRIATPVLNKALAEAASLGQARRSFRVTYAAQTGTRPPSFVIFGRGKAEQAEPLRRYVVNRLREEFGFVGTPVRVTFQEEESRRRRRRPHAKRGPTQAGMSHAKHKSTGARDRTQRGDR